jgi:methylaspartate mutase epsilon subunit
MEAIIREVHELIDPVLERPDLVRSIGTAFDEGRLDVPFGASRYVRSAVMPCRDAEGAIRFANVGDLPFSAATRRRNDRLLRDRSRGQGAFDSLVQDVTYFSRNSTVDPLRWLTGPSAQHPV